MRIGHLLLATLLTGTARAQTSVQVRVITATDSAPIQNAVVRAGTVSARTGADGEASLTVAPAVAWVVATRIGFAPDSAAIGSPGTIVIPLQRATEMEGMVISATRSERRIEEDPLRVEVLDREEVEEKLRMTPGDITMMLNETSGLRVQTTSPSLGGANVRVQGLRGRYTQILSDGLPLFGAQTGGLGLLQIPPMDLGGVEVIKGVASALYGGNALGGVINLLSRIPEEEPTNELLLNQTMLAGSDVVGFSSRRFTDAWAGSGLLGYHVQAQRDVDKDGWVDTPSHDRLVVRPRVYWTGESGHTAMLTAGTTLEARSGGGLQPTDGQRYEEKLDTRRFDVGGVSRWLLGAGALSVRGSVSSQNHEHQFGSVIENDRHLSTFGEAALTRTHDGKTIVAGAALQYDRYRNRAVTGFDFDFVTPGAFAQVTFDPTPRLAVTASGRVDHHGEYGTHLSPRLSALLRLPAEFTARMSGGEGFFAPTPLTEETEVIGLSRVAPLRGIIAEKARTFSMDLGRSFAGVEANATFFHSSIRHPVGVAEEIAPNDAPTGRVRLANMEEPTRTSGVELITRWKPEPFHLTASWTFTDAREQTPGLGVERIVPLTPRHQAGFVGAWESEAARAGVEVYYTGVQSLADNPYRTRSRPYTHLGALVERRFGRARVFVNAENLLGFRQTTYDPLVLPARGPGGRWTTDVWGPLEGRTANIGVRF